MNNKEIIIGEGEKKKVIIQFVGVSIFLIIAVIASFVIDSVLTNNKKVQEIINEDIQLEIIEAHNIVINPENNEKFTTNFGFVLENVFNDTGHLVPDSMRNSKNLIDDEVSMFKMVYFIIDKFDENENKIYDVNINGENETGYFAVNYEYYKNYYYELIGRVFNEEVLAQVEDTFIRRGDYLFYLLPSEYKNNYQLISESFVEEKGKYYFTTLINELDENNQIVLSYRMKFELHIINDKYVISEIIFY